MIRKNVAQVAAVFVLMSVIATHTRAQNNSASGTPAGGNATQVTATQPTTGPAEGKTAIKAKVIEVKGEVQWAPLDGTNWQPVKEGDEYPEQTKILTGLRSSVKFQIGDEQPYTCLLVDSAGRTIISEAYKTGDTKRVRVGVTYGRVKAGVAEGGLKSDFTVDSPVATLSKRGTWGFSLYYERQTNVFEIGLTDYGLVEALNRVTGDKRSVLPGQVVTQAMRRWLDESQIRRNVAVPDMLGQSDVEVAFNRIEQDGVGVTNPGGGRSTVINLSSSGAQQDFANLIDRTIGQTPIAGPPSAAGPRVREEGFFGTGRGDQLIEVLINAGDSLARQGAAKPGRYSFRRSALETWRQSARGK